MEAGPHISRLGLLRAASHVVDNTEERATFLFMLDAIEHITRHVVMNRSEPNNGLVRTGDPQTARQSAQP